MDRRGRGVDRILSAALLLTMALGGGAYGADQTILGTVLMLKSPSTADKRRIIVKARESASDNTIVGDPIADGATLTVVVHGGVSSSDTYVLPSGSSPLTGRSFWSGNLLKGFKYRDYRGENGAVRTAQIRLTGTVFQITIKVDAKLGTVAVTPPNPGSDACVLFSIGSGDSYSVKFASGRISNSDAGLFKVDDPTDEGSCLRSLACLGDSNTASGWPTTETVRWCEYAQVECPRLPDGTPVVWHDFGIGGAVVAPGPYVDYELAEAQGVRANAVVLAFGTNDAGSAEGGFLNSESPTEYAANVAAACQRAAASCYVMTMPPHSVIDYAAYNEAVAAVIPAHWLIDRTTGMTFEADGVHLDDASQRELARRARTAVCGY